jgi:hypothetical protein
VVEMLMAAIYYPQAKLTDWINSCAAPTAWN